MGSKIEALSNTFISDKTYIGVNRLVEDMKKLLFNKDSADVTIIVGTEEKPFHAHKLILSARCKTIFDHSTESCSVPSSINSTLHMSTIRLPQYHPNIFQQILLYIYTGKVVLNDSDVFHILSIGQDLGIDELYQICLDHIVRDMTPSNACLYLSSALDVCKSSNETDFVAFLNQIVSYIGENALSCLQSSAFLSLSQDALIRLISSDCLALEEEDVWRAVLCWAKDKAGVSQPTSHWSESERLRVCQHLHGVINHVRLLLIDSQVFAEEVEPTGAVPMELSLERYRFAALATKAAKEGSGAASGPGDKRLQPRLSLKLFSGSQILNNERASLQRVLNGWYGASKQVWRLVYRASSHGFSADAFHKHCDSIAPTYTVILGEKGDICGGFSDVPWCSATFKGKYAASDKAFLFSLVAGQNSTPVKYPVIKKIFAICYHPDCGPIFGAGADLFISSDCNENADSYSNLPHSYDGPDACCSSLMADYNFTVADYEVFSPYGAS